MPREKRSMVLVAYPSPEMYRVLAEFKENNRLLAYPPSPSSLSASLQPPYSNIYPKESSTSPPSSSGNRISPAVLFIIVILAVIFFISGLLHLLVRFLIKQPSPSSTSQSHRYPDISGSDALQRQLQQLFHLHDSGLDQAFIDALPVFLYKEIVGLKEPFDCAVCLCEFSEEDKLRLLPICSHAFHLHCIDTWLLSNSTCPLCRGTLFSPGLAIENPIFEFNDSREEDRGSNEGEDGFTTNQKFTEVEEMVVEKRVFPVRLGKFRSLTDGEEGQAAGETSSSNLDARRCYSMGSYQYVLGDSHLQVALSQDTDERPHSRRSSISANTSLQGDMEGKKLSVGKKGESFSVSKIWLWSKKGKFASSSDNDSGILSDPHQIPVWISRTQDT
ncbi:RING-H2 finger protein ATL46-like [Aristolochia californica]|uniref:RING-H2 finger protein ATL46-like n=1 Tax=Aristolochia californica TaxID=171875 RepID=UPI0035DBA72B